MRRQYKTWVEVKMGGVGKTCWVALASNPALIEKGKRLGQGERQEQNKCLEISDD